MNRTNAGFCFGVILTVVISASAADAPARKVEAPFPKVTVESAYVKKATWGATLLASIDKLRKDNPGFALGRCTLKDRWFRKGPFKTPGDAVPPTKIDLRAKDASGKRIWDYKGSARNDYPHDLKIPKGSSIYQVRQYHCDRAGVLEMYLASEIPLTMWRNGKQIYAAKTGQTDIWKPALIKLNVLKGRNELLIRFDNKSSDSTRFFIKFNNITNQWHKSVERLQGRVAEDFNSPWDAFQQNVDFTKKIWVAPWTMDDQAKGAGELARRYAKTVADPAYRKVFDDAAKTVKTYDAFNAVRAACYHYRLSSALQTRANFLALKRAVANMGKTSRKPKSFDAKAAAGRVDQLEKEFAALVAEKLRIKPPSDFTVENVLAMKPISNADYAKIDSLVGELTTLQRDVLLSNPSLDFERLLLIKRRAGNLGLPQNWVGAGGMSGNLNDELVVMNLRDPDAKLDRSFKPDNGASIADVDLNWDGKRVLYSSISKASRTWQIFEIVIDPVTGKMVTKPRQLTPKMADGVKNYDACYLPDDRILFCSTAVRQGVPCLAGSGEIANLYLMSKDGKKVRQLCFDQDHNWNPTVLNNGRVLYLRWEYVDTPHYFDRILFQMNPDGTGQLAYYGSNSYWPNAIFGARPIPGHPTKIVGIVSGHHGVARMGELVIFDTALGRRETEGVVQRIPGYGKKVERVIADHLVGSSWPKFLHPYPIDENNFIVASKPSPNANWGLYLVDVFDNMLLLKESDDFVYFEPLPLRTTKKPPLIPDRVDLTRKDASVYIDNIYSGPGLAGTPVGSIKRIRLLEPHYNYSGKHTGGYINAAIEGGWEPKRILGTVPVEPDGSATFRVPANTPLILQPVDKQGRAYQIMRSWMTAMPGEVVSCGGCHEETNTTMPVRASLASRKKPADIEPWYGFTRGYDFVRELQPVLNAKCIKCHDGKKKDRPNFADTKHGQHEFYNSYHALHPYVRRPGPEGDFHMLQPMEYHASTSELVQIIEKGHYKVKLNPEQWDRLVTWIDMNVPAFGTWGDRMGSAFIAKQHKARLDLRKLYASVSDDPEIPLGDPTSPFNVEFAAKAKGKITRTNIPAPPTEPRPAVKGATKPPQKIEGWPFKAKPSDDRITVVLGKSEIKGKGKNSDNDKKISLEMIRIPAGQFVMGSDDGDIDEGPRRLVKIDKAFYMAAVETTNEMYNLFNPKHDTRYADRAGMSQTTEGLPLNRPKQPVSRIRWKDAMAFCKWLSDKTGDAYTLPTEAQWEWACRAGTDTPFYYGDVDTDFAPHANLADKAIIALSFRQYRPVMEDFIPRDRRYDDKNCVTADVGSYKPNPFGLYDMHGNVSEWTLSEYGKCASGYDRMAVRGGSWRDRPKKARVSWRWGYYKFQPVFDVGFRVVRSSD